MNELETRAERIDPTLAAADWEAGASYEDVMSEEMVAIYRAKTPTERLQIAFGMWRSARKIAFAAVRQQHPDWSEAEQQAEVARRMSDGLV